jgi:hypothetical protein
MALNSISAYNYRPLVNERNIRVLKLYGSSDPKSMIEIDLIENSLDLPAKYYAISYCWQGQEPSRIVLCQGFTLLMTANCEAALRCFPGGPKSKVLLWIDAICISQSTEAVGERSRQVSMTGEIYSSAEQSVDLAWNSGA